MGDRANVYIKEQNSGVYLYTHWKGGRMTRWLPLFPLVFAVLAFLATPAHAQTTVYVTPTAKHYHLFADCQTLKHSTKVHTVQLSAVGERTLCGFCRKRAADTSKEK